VRREKREESSSCSSSSSRGGRRGGGGGRSAAAALSAPRCVYKTKPTTSQLVLAGAPFSAWLVLITSCQQRVAILVRPRAGQAEAEAAASSQQLALAAAAAAARSSFFVGKKSPAAQYKYKCQ
jgi:hypothetical protein